MTLPIVHLSGTPYEQGVRHGEELKDRIAHNLRVYFARFEREIKLTREEVLRRARLYAEAIQSQNRDYYDGIRGVAAGSGFYFDEIAALQVRYEILYYQFGVNATAKEQAKAAESVDGCTAFAVLPEASANGHLLIGQNWDWIPEVQGAILHTTGEDGLETLSYTEAGIVGGKIGLNSAGLGLAINGMTSTDDDWSRLRKPFHVRCYEILRSREFAQAMEIITGEDRSCSTNYLIAQTPDKVADIEVSPDKFRLLGCEDGCAVHTNHFDDPAGLGVTEPPNERRPFSYHRRARLTELLAAKRPISLPDVEGYLKDHAEYPFGVCRHRDPTVAPEEHYITVTSATMDLDARTLRLTDGPPCESDAQTVQL